MSISHSLSLSRERILRGTEHTYKIFTHNRVQGSKRSSLNCFFFFLTKKRGWKKKKTVNYILVSNTFRFYGKLNIIYNSGAKKQHEKQKKK